MYGFEKFDGVVRKTVVGERRLERNKGAAVGARKGC